MKVLINLLKFITITILAICIIAIGIIQIGSSTILNKNYVIQKLEETNFYGETYELVKSNFENYIYQSGLEEEVLEDICSEEKVKKDINIMLSNIYDGANQKIDTTEIADNLNSNIDKQGVRTSQNEKAIQQFVTHICDEYTNTLIHTQYESKINNMYTKVVDIIEKLNKIILTVLVICIILLIIINKKEISKDIKNLGMVLLSASTFDLIVYYIINSKINIQGIKIFNDTFSKTLVSVLNELLNKLSLYGVIALVIAIIAIVIGSIIYAVKNKKSDSDLNT